MIEESVQVLSVEVDYLWVEGVQGSACQSCAVQRGCGQGLLAKLGARPVRLRVSLSGRDPAMFQAGQNVTIGIADNVVARGSLLMYLLPLLALLGGIGLGERFLDNDFAAMISGLFALFGGGLLAGRLATRAKQRAMMEPQLLDVRA